MSEIPASQPAALRPVFVSYAHDDAAAARRLAEALRAAGLEVWFDENELRSGDTWDAKIKQQISECALFLPIISQNTQRRREGYFRLEWHLAEERSRLIARGTPFLVPVVVDETSERGALVPEVFLSVQWTRLRDGAATAAFAERVKSLLADDSDVGRGLPTPPSTRHTSEPAGPGDPALQLKVGHRVPAAAWLALAAVAALAIAAFAILRPSQNAGAGTHSPTVDRSSIAASPAAAPVANDKSIAILPFANLSPDKENEFFADGMHADLLSNLLGLRELRVISAQSVSGFRGTTKRIPEIARELGVAYILTGSVRRAGDTFRVSTQLIDARTDSPLWAPQPYTRKLTDLFALQSELAQAIATELKAVLSPEEKTRLERRPTENLAAYDLYLKSRDPVMRAGPTGPWLSQREKLLQEAVRLDPNFTLAWVALANVHLLTYGWGYEHTSARLNRAKEALATAEGLEPESIEVLSETGFFYSNGLFDFPRAKACYERVLKRVPNYAHVWARQGYVARAESRWGDSISNLRKAHELDRRDADYVRELANSLRAVRRFDEAETVTRELVDLLPEVAAEAYRLREFSFLARGSIAELDDWFAGLSLASKADSTVEALARDWARQRGDMESVVQSDQDPIGRAMILAHRGDRKQAAEVLAVRRQTLQNRTTADQDDRDTWISLGLALAISGDRDQALSAAMRAIRLMPESRHAWWGAVLAAERAKILAWTGEKDEAVGEIARLLHKPSNMNVHELRRSIEWLPLRGHPHFEAILNDPKNNAPLF